MRAGRFLGCMVVALIFASLALAGDVDGQWSGKTKDGYDVVLNLKSEGAEVSGTLQGADGKTEYPLQDVKSDGGNLAFAVDIQWQGNPLRIVAKGKMADAQIQLHLETENASWSSDAALSRATR